MSKHIQTQTEWEQTMARRVMEQLRGELYLDQRYLTAALGALPPAPQQGGGSFATDGGRLYYRTACSTASSAISGCGISATPTCGASPAILRWKARWTP